jgi:hypothetical protein
MLRQQSHKLFYKIDFCGSFRMSKQEEEKAVPGSMQKLTVEAIGILPAEASSRLHYAD